MKSSNRILTMREKSEWKQSEITSDADNHQKGHGYLEDPTGKIKLETFENFCKSAGVKMPFFFATDVPAAKQKSIHYGVRSYNDYLESYNHLFSKLEVFIEKKVAERTVELREANHDLDSFAYSVSHDLRGPLQVIKSYSSLLSKKYSSALDDDAKELLDGIMAYSNHMSLIMDNLLNLSRLGKVTISKAEVDMHKLVHGVLADLTPVWENANAKIRLLNLSPTLCDAGLVKQVWINLISNALKYSMNKEKPEIEIGIIEQRSELVYYIKDNGVGFNMKYADKLFGLFQRLHNNSEFEGTGVGLNIVYRIVSKHGGRIWAEAKENEGATFYFTLK